jgi:CDP-glucose 4,6-dehydratase
VFGGGDLNWSRVVPGTIRSLVRSEAPVLRSDGTFVRDYIYVKDVAESYLTLASALDTASVAGEAFNFSAEAPLTVRQIVDRIRVLMHREDLEPDIRNEAVGEIHAQTLSAEKARTRLGWRPRFELDTGLRETIAWYREFLG